MRGFRALGDTKERLHIAHTAHPLFSVAVGEEGIQEPNRSEEPP